MDTHSPHERPALSADSPLAVLRQRLAVLRWLIPAGLLALVILYEVGPSYWIQAQYGATWHLLAEIAVYGSIGPILALLVINFLGRWLEERETSELQAQILSRARALSEVNHRLSDDVLQGLFAVSVLMASAESPAMPPESAARLREAENALDQAIRRLREHILDHPTPGNAA